MKKITRIVAAGLTLMALLVPTMVSAAEFMKSADDSGNVVLSSTETHKNLYTAGGSVSVNSTTKGDVFAAGGTVTIDGPVEQDAVITGGTLTINNNIGGDVRLAGGTVTINAQVGGDVLAAGGTLVISEKASVGGDVVVAGGTVTINAPVSGKVWLAGGTVIINSKIGGPVTIRGDKSVTFGPKAEVTGAVKVWGQQEPVVQDGAQVSPIDFQKKNANFSTAQVARAVFLGGLIWVLAYLFLALVLSWVAPKRIASFNTQVKAHFWMNTVIGLAGLVVTPIVAILLCVVVVGYQLAFLLIAAYLLALAVSWALAVMWTGSWLYQLISRQATMHVGWQTAIVGALAFTFVRFIPVVGSVICFIIFVACLGQFLTNIKHALVEKAGEVKE